MLFIYLSNYLFIYLFYLSIKVLQHRVSEEGLGGPQEVVRECRRGGQGGQEGKESRQEEEGCLRHGCRRLISGHIALTDIKKKN